MVDDEDNIGAWVRGLRGRLDSNGGTPVDWYVEFLLDNVASVDNLPPAHPMIAELLEYRQELLDEFRWLRELIG